MDDRQPIRGQRDTALPDQLPAGMIKAWNGGWRPRRTSTLKKFWCLAGCGSSLTTWDNELVSFVCSACRRQAGVWLLLKGGSTRKPRAVATTALY